MKVYSNNINLFTKRCEESLKKILSSEVGCKIGRTRFTFNSLSYPLKIVCFESQRTLGYFDPHTYQIGLNKKLMFGVKEKTINDILRHELAHYLNYIETTDLTLPHGDEFKAICQRFNWSDSVSKASIDINLADENLEGDLVAEKLKRKFRSLLKLSSSDNPHEAELATVKANQLLLKYNLSKLNSPCDDVIYTDVLFTVKKKNAKIIALYDILSTFMVKPILIYGQKQVSLEVCGSRENIELAHYVCNFLSSSFDDLWKGSELKGLRAKNSFFTGIAKGYLEKSEGAINEQSPEMKKDLIILKEKLSLNLELIYPRLSHTSSSSSLDHGAFRKGHCAGTNLTINPALKNTKNKIKQLMGIS